ncbi:unnamed protein product [Pylaiella littoralis]
MSASSGGRTKKQGRSMTLALGGSPLVGRHIKRGGKSPGAATPKPPGTKGAPAALATDESGIVLDRLGKEIVTLLQAGGAKKKAVRRRLRLGINEVTRFLEAIAAAAAATVPEPSSFSSCGGAPPRGKDGESSKNKTARQGEGGGDGDRPGAAGGKRPACSPHPTSSPVPPAAAIVLICRDVRPARLVEHVHALVALTGTPHLILSQSSSSLGEMFGCKTMAAMAVCPARSPPPLPQALSRPPHSAADPGGTEDIIAQQPTSSGQDGSRSGGSGSGGGEGGGVGARSGGGGSSAMLSATRERVDGGGEEEGRKEEGAGRGELVGGGSGGGSVAPDDRDRVAVDEDVDSFIEFLRRKVRVRSSTTTT